MTQSNILFIGMDVHKESVVISLADDDRSEVRRYGVIGGTMADFKKTLRNFVSTGKEFFSVMRRVPVAMNCIGSLPLKVINALLSRPRLFRKKPVIRSKQINVMQITSRDYYAQAT